MRVFIKNKLVSLGGSSTVKNDMQQDVYFVKGKVISPTKKKKICDLKGNVLYTVRNKWFRLFSYKAFIKDADNKKIACIRRGLFNYKKFDIEGYKDEISIQGEFFSLRSQIVRNGVVVGTIDRQFTLVQDAFCLEGAEQDMPFLIALVIGIDNITDRARK